MAGVRAARRDGEAGGDRRSAWPGIRAGRSTITRCSTRCWPCCAATRSSGCAITPRSCRCRRTAATIPDRSSSTSRTSSSSRRCAAAACRLGCAPFRCRPRANAPRPPASRPATASRWSPRWSIPTGVTPMVMARLRSYDRAGFLKIDPDAVRYLQPDFRAGGGDRRELGAAGTAGAGHPPRRPRARARCAGGEVREHRRARSTPCSASTSAPTTWRRCGGCSITSRARVRRWRCGRRCPDPQMNTDGHTDEHEAPPPMPLMTIDAIRQATTRVLRVYWLGVREWGFVFICGHPCSSDGSSA